MEEPRDPPRRTELANERTQLAWWRTGLTALAVALAVGRILPDLGEPASEWPYTVVGVGFALYALLLIAYGTQRARSVRAALAEGRDIPGQGAVLLALTAIGAALAAATTLLIVVD